MEEARADVQKLVASQTVSKEEIAGNYRQSRPTGRDATALLQTQDQFGEKIHFRCEQCNKRCWSFRQAFEKDCAI